MHVVYKLNDSGHPRQRTFSACLVFYRNQDSLSDGVVRLTAVSTAATQEGALSGLLRDIQRMQNSIPLNKPQGDIRAYLVERGWDI